MPFLSIQLSVISLGKWENIYIQPEALKTPRKMFQTWPGWADKNFQGGTIFLAQLLKNFILGSKNRLTLYYMSVGLTYTFLTINFRTGCCHGINKDFIYLCIPLGKRL